MTPDVIFPDLFLFIRLSPRYGLLLSRFFQPSAAAPFRLHSVCGACMFCSGNRRENSFPVLRFLCSRNGFVIVQQLSCRAFGRDCRAQFILRYFPHHLLTIIGPAEPEATMPPSDKFRYFHQNCLSRKLPGKRKTKSLLPLVPNESD